MGLLGDDFGWYTPGYVPYNIILYIYIYIYIYIYTNVSVQVQGLCTRLGLSRFGPRNLEFSRENI